jgi:hypothetical protein
VREFFFLSSEDVVQTQTCAENLERRVSVLSLLWCPSASECSFQGGNLRPRVTAAPLVKKNLPFVPKPETAALETHQLRTLHQLRRFSPKLATR